MPSWKMHLIFDLIFVIVFIGTIFRTRIIDNIFLLVFLVLFNLLATLFPDIDTPKSKIRKYISFALTIVIGIYLIINFTVNSLIFGITTMILIYLILRFFPTKHRGVTHTFLFGITLSAILTFILWFLFEISLNQLGISFFIILWGYSSHLILDKL